MRSPDVCHSCGVWWDHEGCTGSGCECENIIHGGRTDEDLEKRQELARLYAMPGDEQVKRRQSLLRELLDREGRRRARALPYNNALPVPETGGTEHEPQSRQVSDNVRNG